MAQDRGPHGQVFVRGVARWSEAQSWDSIQTRSRAPRRVASKLLLETKPNPCDFPAPCGCPSGGHRAPGFTLEDQELLSLHG
jgi:hypothetical protein